MEQRNRNVLIGLIALVIAAAVFSSFGLPYFSAPTATITLPTPLPSDGQTTEGEGPNHTRVLVTPETVQSVIAAMSRAESYARTVTLSMEGRTATVGIWVDGAWTRSEWAPAGEQKVYTIVGEETVWRWYEGDRRAVSWKGDAASHDLEGQHLPSYEDVLSLELSALTEAGYEEKDGVDCVFVGAWFPELEQTERYWIAADTGLLVAAETRGPEDTLLWSMSATAIEIPLPAGTNFTLPDGTVLHQVSREES